jgi:hypothetical protein
MVRALLFVPVALLVAACGGGDGGTPERGPASVAAIPAVPHVRGPIRVRLQPALPLVGGESCTPGYGLYCLGERGYRALGEGRAATIASVRTAPNDDHTAWDTVVRFETPASVGRASERAAGMGGVVLVLAGRDRAVAAVPPSEIGPARARFLGLEKAEAWALVDAFSRSKQGM